MKIFDWANSFWEFLKKDTWSSWLVSFFLLIIIIKFIIFPSLSFITGSELPLVVVESCSMYHETDFNNWWEKNAPWYEDHGISEQNFELFTLKNGFSKGDIIFVMGRDSYNLGDVIIFNSNPESFARYPIIHRIVSLDPIGTKGDHNVEQLARENNVQHIDETDIPEDRIIGKAVFKIPALGWVKLVFFELTKTPDQRGLCK